MLNVFFTALLTGSCTVFVWSQDTIDDYHTLQGQPCTFEEAAFFLKETDDPQKPLAIFHLYDPVLYERLNFERPVTSVKNGSYVFMENGKVVQTASYISDKETGKTVRYYPDGKTADTELFSEGKREGICDYYYPNGQLSSRETYLADSLIGFELYNEDGSRDSVTPTHMEAASFPGGIVAMRSYLSDSLVYPQIARELGLEGKCHLQFTVDAEGRISEVTVKRGVPDCPECDAEAVRVVKLMPDWKPARLHNRAIDSIFNLPISFKLQGKEKKPKKRKS